jgi:hypothetical protein
MQKLAPLQVTVAALKEFLLLDVRISFAAEQKTRQNRTTNEEQVRAVGVSNGTRARTVRG